MNSIMATATATATLGSFPFTLRLYMPADLRSKGSMRKSQTNRPAVSFFP